MIRTAGLFFLSLVAGCATTDVAPPKLSFDEAMGWRASHAQAKYADAPEGTDPRASGSLAAAMKTFMATSRAQRTATPRGAPMPADHVAAWLQVLDEVEAFAAVPAASSAVMDTVRTRLQLETEFETCGSTYGDVPAEVSERAQAALAALSTKLAAQTATTRTKAQPTGFKLKWPVLPVIVTSPYGDRLHPIRGEYLFHSGLDLAAEADQSVFAAEAGTVVFSGWNGGHGKQVEVQHDGHLSTRYSHLDELLVKDGQHVRKGELLGLAGATGLATGVHLHFEIRRDGTAVDPEFVMNATEAVAGATGARP